MAPSSFTVYYADTDSYGVVWHGSYLRWLEAGRVDYLLENGLDIMRLQDECGIVLPVVSLDIKYIRSARCGDKVSVHTNIEEIKNVSAIFTQEIVDTKDSSLVYVRAVLKCGGIDRDGKVVKNLKEILGRTIKC